MGLSRSQQNLLNNVQGFKPVGKLAMAAVLGRGKWRMTTGVGIWLVIFVVDLVCALTGSIVFLPTAALILIVVVLRARPFLVLAVSKNQLVLLRRNYWTGKPDRVVEAANVSVLAPQNVIIKKTVVAIIFKNDKVLIRKADYELLASVGKKDKRSGVE